MAINEDNVLLELKKRNTKALEYIINTYSNLVFKVVINVLGNDNYESAKECLNDIYLLVWNKNQLYNPEKASFKNWLLAVSKYKAIDYKRSLKKTNNVNIEDEFLFSSNNVENEYILKEKKKELLELLDNESKTDREIFIRKYIFDEDINSITQKLKLSKGAVYNRLWRTRNSLTEKLNVQCEGEVIK
ncbi:sigma-70 family RNA polymerase sigma factor [Clostridium beijerinckii]|uniref:RNA polymerase sigma-70 factor (ECF subfamily) n=1 Tax=Clostridium beijerinckii TaxID=1520 RepID=A0A9Q5CSM5_CLOBE|nr:sigma-70 family RNA polymerase sigma factor [Clostridium beijerinckii]AQS06296.1 RNA polymerase factor sigma-70 [Clostridium beijerinckii]MBA2888340.1 RNA polymerase sigma-70 factor (ECF subfamily) [Clostridium beijerinckii]MBA2903108.1 RNA polymerase sigma-70 factor (ECF subfamily) [Clostridium beijerinckii]MBA2912930.1 RNA polymerase sigma-70 factor (ECF subfamily) [Clostridium beijerinckii]MBA9014091.1 RNA polymerase sigma-70 factor (ECF subfamily) [Clostridium beijerinckii]